MKKFVTLLLCMLPVSLFAQVNDGIRQAMDNYDYETVVTLIEPDCQDSLLLITKAQALKAMNRYPEAIGVLNSLILKDSTNTKVLIDLAECYKLTGNSRRAANCYQKAMNLQPENKFFRLQFIRSLLASEDYEEARTACHGWLERDSLSATGYKYLGQAYEGLQDAASAFLSYNIAYRRDSLDAQTVARIAGIFNNNQQFKDAVDVTEVYRLSDTTNIDVNRQNAKAYCMLKEYGTAVKRYESLKELGDRSFLTLYYLGVSHYGDNWFYGAYDNLKEAYQKNPMDVNVLYYLAKASARTSWKKEGVEYMEEAFRIAVPSDSMMVRLYDGLVECYDYAGDTKKEVEALEKLYIYTKKNSILYKIACLYDWKEDGTDTILVEKEGIFSAFIPMEHTTFYLLTHQPKVGEPLRSCIRGAEIIARVGDDIKLEGSLDYLGAVRHSGGFYDNSLVARYDSLTASSNTEMIDIFSQILKYQDTKQNDSVAKYGQMYNEYHRPLMLKIVRDSLALKVNDMEYAAFMYASAFVFDATYKDVKERLAQFTPEVQNSYFGQILDKQLLVLKNIEVGFAPAEFTVTDKDGRKVSLSDYKGKYVLIYHWGLCPGTFWVNPKITDLYQKYHEKGLEVLGFTRDDLLKSLQGSSEEFKKDERVQGLLSHPWTTVYTEDEGNGFIVKDLYFSGVPILMLISPDGITLARGYTKAYEEVKNLLDRNLGNK